MVFKNNPKVYLQQDLPNHVFDCYVFPPRASSNAKIAEAAKTGGGIPKLKVLVTGAQADNW